MGVPLERDRYQDHVANMGSLVHACATQSAQKARVKDVTQSSEQSIA